MEIPPQDQIVALTELYDRFSSSISLTPERLRAEKAFNDELANWYDILDGPKPDFRFFRKELIRRCKVQIRMTNQAPASLPPFA